MVFTRPLSLCLVGVGQDTLYELLSIGLGYGRYSHWMMLGAGPWLHPFFSRIAIIIDRSGKGED